jgi:hypothetical protein
MDWFIRTTTTIVFTLAALVAACDKPAPEEPPKPRWQYTQEDFAIGKPHTKNVRCNREIDELLEQIRGCFNTREHAACDSLQQQNSQKIARLKNATRCRH